MKTVVVSLEARFYKTPDGKIWADKGFPENFWERYFTAFDKVKILARVGHVERTVEGWKTIHHPNAEIIELPYYVGPMQYLLVKSKLTKILESNINPNDSYILRVPSVIGHQLYKMLLKRNIPYAVEVVGDPYDVFQKGSVNHPLRAFFQWYFTNKLKDICAHAFSGSYVTDRILQNRYPLPTGSYSIAASSIKLEDSHISESAKVIPADKKDFILSVTGNLETNVKGTDVIIKMMKHLKENSSKSFTLNIAGDGRKKEDFINMARELGVLENINFLGQVPAGSEVRDLLDSTDIFILPSRGEGLPRAMIEAMARGLFCLSSDINCFTELLDPSCLTRTGDHIDLATRVENFTSDISRMNELAKENLENSKRYKNSILSQRRSDFYQHVSSHG